MAILFLDWRRQLSTPLVPLLSYSGERPSSPFVAKSHRGNGKPAEWSRRDGIGQEPNTMPKVPCTLGGGGETGFSDKTVLMGRMGNASPLGGCVDITGSQGGVQGLVEEVTGLANVIQGRRFLIFVYCFLLWKTCQHGGRLR